MRPDLPKIWRRVGAGTIPAPPVQTSMTPSWSMASCWASIISAFRSSRYPFVQIELSSEGSIRYPPMALEQLNHLFQHFVERHVRPSTYPRLLGHVWELRNASTLRVYLNVVWKRRYQGLYRKFACVDDLGWSEPYIGRTVIHKLVW